MKNFFTLGLILKFLMVIVFYFGDVVINPSGNHYANRNFATDASGNNLINQHISIGSLSDNNLINWGISMDSPGLYPLHKTLDLDWKQIRSVSRRINNDFSDFDGFEHLESAIAFMLGKYDIKGASVAVARDGQLVFAKGLGYADAESEEPVKPAHLFRIASVSKLITATTIMKMRELDLLDIDDKVFGKDGILNDPVYLNYADPRVEDITVRHLLNHSSGWDRRYGDHIAMHYHIARDMQINNNDLSVTDILTFAMKNGLHFDPGSRTSYSNLGYVILGQIIEAVSGVNYESYVRKTILLPLGIQEMRIGGSHLEERFKNEVKYYETAYIPEDHHAYGNDRLIPLPYGGNDIKLLGAAGGWIASPAEIMKLVVSIDTIPDTPNLLSPESIELMTDTNLSGGHPIGWAGTDGRGNWWRTGTLSGTSALVMRQNNGISWAVFFNSSTYKGISLPRETHKEVHTALNRVKNWPEHNLFYHFESFPYRYPDIAELR